MTPELLVVLHIGHGHVPLEDYLARVLLHLLVFAVVGIVAWAFLRIVTVVATKREGDREIEVTDR